MSHRSNQFLRLALVCLAFLSACRTAGQPSTPSPLPPLNVILLYPKADTVVEMGKTLKFIVQVMDAGGTPVNDAQITIFMRDPQGNPEGEIEAIAGAADAYRSDAWPVAHRMPAGSWSVLVQARQGETIWETNGSFEVKNSTSETLLAKYGFWLAEPALKGIQAFLTAERGDAENGLIRWGGIIPAQHIFPENWVEIHWRKGRYPLDSPQAVRGFLLQELGDLGFTPLREIGDFAPARFKNWDAWQGKARGEFERYDMEWMVFYAPEVDKTYALATTVVLPPVGIDPHATLRDSFAVYPGIVVQGEAPAPLLDLAPAPQLLSPALGARFEGVDQPIVIQWQAVKDLADDEYYEVVVDYNYRETNIKKRFYTQDTQVTLPTDLYHEPNCHVYNWRVTLNRQTGVAEDGRPTGEPMTYPSLYWYVLWMYPADEKQPFPYFCPNAQY